ncbi:MAG: hypothetical protein ACKVOW_07845 [Chitinophagaceae bacterium]
MINKKNTSPHILNTSSNLLGICFIVLTSLKVMKVQHETSIDEFTAAAMILFMTSSILSFLSIKTNSDKSDKFENIADIFFLMGLCCLFGTTMLVTFKVVS